MMPGQHWVTRGGAVVEIVERRDTGLTQYDKSGAPHKAFMLICRVVTCADGTDAALLDAPRQFGLFDDGSYGARAHELDLVQRVAEAAA